MEGSPSQSGSSSSNIAVLNENMSDNQALIDPTPFNYYSKESVIRLELHLRTWVTILERICFSPIVLSKELRDNVYSSLAKFAEIHRKTTLVIEIGLDNSFRPNFNQFNH
ncbi:hypothetical protein GLOIN_2v1768320 [Rhizophagus clarus]|uniref:Uncharacterized protein n=1 Tax=Rhizophagus clarus TaxID=94130 RepID=A0A8H3LJL0_9GLOM|nr:hypothetical protein GLOIN_2v1768320 [Rhizophagus clarus]